MKRRTALGLLAAGPMAALLDGCAAPARAPTHDGDAYLFAYFVQNGQDGLHLAGSLDGYHWDKLKGGAPFLEPTVGKEKLMRDPCLVRGPDGVYHMVWTCSWQDRSIGYASSKDLLHWSPQRALPVMAHEPDALNAWAPEIVWDAARGEYLIFWASTIPGRFPETDKSGDGKYNHRIYATTTRDFVQFTPTVLFYDPGFSVIDATFLRANGRDWLLVKDETRTPAHKYLQLAPAASLHGPFGPLGAPISPAGLWAEGPTALQVGDEVIVYFDAYTARHYGALRSRDLVHWEDVTGLTRFPDEGTALRMRHGTVIKVPIALLDALRVSVPAA
jgi:beta-xylosidase